MSRSRQAALLLLLASAALWGGALFFQYVVGLAPCELCLLQRWPHKIVIVLALLALFAGDRASTPWLLALCGAVLAAGAAIACTGAPQSAATVEELKRQIMGQQPVRCDRIAWSLFGISMAGWNFLASTALAVFAFAAAAHLRRPRARTA
jgi:disulfide bond formation protein DsbB